MSEKKINILYYIMMAVFVIIVLSATLLGQGKTNSEEVFPSGKIPIHQYKEDISKDGLTKTYYFHADDILKNGSTLIFHERHHDIKIYSGDRIIYDLTAESTLVGHTTGYKWVFCNIKDNKNPIKVVTTALYDDVRMDEPIFYAGEKSALIYSLYLDSKSHFAIGTLNIISGILVLICFFLMKNKSKSVRDMIYIAIVTILFGLYEFVNASSVQLMVSNQVVLSSISFFILMLISVPFDIYIKETIFPEDRHIYKVLITYSFIESILCIILLETHVCDLKQSAILTHISILLCGIYAITGVIYKFIHHGFQRTTLANVIGLSICASFCLIDILRYYFVDGVNYDEVMIRIGFTIYLVTLIFINILNMIKEVQIGQQASYYQKLSITDMMTNMYNHTAFIDDADSIDKSEIYTIISMDLNNLKRVNDQQGHIDGDKYIKAAAETIKNVFGKYGKCYRIGGDEFAVILREKYKGKAPSLIKELTENINEYNINLPLDAPNRLIIAAGYSENIPNTDQNFESVLKRADELMYKNKKEIKLAERRAGVQDDYVDPRLT